MYLFSEEISKSDKVINATIDMHNTPKDYRFKRLVYPDVSIPNRSLAWNLACKSEDSKEVKKLKDSVLKYNRYIEYLESVPGFTDYFLENNLCVSKKALAEKWSTDVAERIFNKGNYCFLTDISVIDDWMFDNTYPVNYKASADGNALYLPVGQNADAYSGKSGDFKVIWNYIDIGHDFCFYLWQILGERYRQNEELDEDDDETTYYAFDAYDQCRYDFVEPQLIRIYQKLEHLGYIRTYTIFPECEDPRWKQYGKGDGSIDCALVNTKFLKNKLIMEQIELLLWTSAEELKAKPYLLTDGNNRQFLSNQGGSFGGYKRQKIYGRLGCPSAARFLANGQYAQHRVFFADEETAIQAGYRPCAKCMPEAYKKWKAKNKT